MTNTDLRTEVHYVNASDGEHYHARIVRSEKDGEREVADLEVDIPVGGRLRSVVLRDEIAKAGNTWHYVEAE